MMDGYGTRASSSISLFTLVLSGAALLNALSVYLYPQNPTGSLTLGNVFDFVVHPYLEADQSNIDFHVKADLRSAFQWNTKQLFVYVVATYVTPQNSRNEVVIWDRIIQHKEDALIDEENILNEYPLRDQYRSLKSREVTLTLAYRYMPIVGIMTEHIVTSTSFTTPEKYFPYDKNRTGRPRGVPDDTSEEEGEGSEEMDEL